MQLHRLAHQHSSCSTWIQAGLSGLFFPAFRYSWNEPACKNCLFLWKGKISEEIRNASRCCADSFRESERCFLLCSKVTPNLCLNLLGCGSSQFGTQHAVSLELPNQEKVKENRWRQRTSWRKVPEMVGWGKAPFFRQIKSPVGGRQTSCFSSPTVPLALTWSFSGNSTCKGTDSSYSSNGSGQSGQGYGDGNYRNMNTTFSFFLPTTNPCMGSAPQGATWLCGPAPAHSLQGKIMLQLKKSRKENSKKKESEALPPLCSM